MSLIVLRLHIPPAVPPRRADTGHLWKEAQEYEAYRTQALEWLPQKLFDSLSALRVLGVADTRYSAALARDPEYYHGEVPEEDRRGDKPIGEWCWWIAVLNDVDGVKIKRISVEEGEKEVARLCLNSTSGII